MKRVAVRPLSSGLVLVFLLQLQCCAVESTMTVSEMRKRKEDAKAAVCSACGVNTFMELWNYVQHVCVFIVIVFVFFCFCFFFRDIEQSQSFCMH